MSQNIDALLGAIAAGRAGAALGGAAGAERPVIVDLGCAGGRDLVALTARGCGRGASEEPGILRASKEGRPGLHHPRARFRRHGPSGNAGRRPSRTRRSSTCRARPATPTSSRSSMHTRSPADVFFASNAYGQAEDKEGCGAERTPAGVDGSAG